MIIGKLAKVSWLEIIRVLFPLYISRILFWSASFSSSPIGVNFGEKISSNICFDTFHKIGFSFISLFPSRWTHRFSSLFLSFRWVSRKCALCRYCSIPYIYCSFLSSPKYAYLAVCRLGKSTPAPCNAWNKSSEKNQSLHDAQTPEKELLYPLVLAQIQTLSYHPFKILSYLLLYSKISKSQEIFSGFSIIKRRYIVFLVIIILCEIRH